MPNTNTTATKATGPDRIKNAEEALNLLADELVGLAKIVGLKKTESEQILTQFRSLKQEVRQTVHEISTRMNFKIKLRNMSEDDADLFVSYIRGKANLPMGHWMEIPAITKEKNAKRSLLSLPTKI